jgi:hypothetical protein
MKTLEHISANMLKEASISTRLKPFDVRIGLNIFILEKQFIFSLWSQKINIPFFQLDCPDKPVDHDRICLFVIIKQNYLSSVLPA